MGDPRLLQVSQPVRDLSAPALKTLVDDMFETMHAASGAGLAAPQIGVPLRVVIFGYRRSVEARNPRYPDADPVPQTILINPVIEPLSATRWKKVGKGACRCRACAASCRATQRSATAESICKGGPIDRVVDGFHARVVQHECDHLDGILYPMRVRDFSRFGYTDILFPGMADADD